VREILEQRVTLRLIHGEQRSTCHENNSSLQRSSCADGSLDPHLAVREISDGVPSDQSERCRIASKELLQESPDIEQLTINGYEMAEHVTRAHNRNADWLHYLHGVQRRTCRQNRDALTDFERAELY